MTTDLEVPPGVAETPPYLRDARDVVSGMGSDATCGPDGGRGGDAALAVRPQRDHRREAAVGVGGRAPAAARPDEHHARRGHGRELRDRRGLDRDHRGAAHPAQRRARLAPGAEGAGERRRAVEPAGAAGEGACATARSRSVPAVDVVPGDIVQVEAGDIVPADGRIVRSATLETQEAALTGESAPVAKDAGALAGADVALGDRSNMLFQNTVGDARHRGDGRDRRPACRPRWARSRRC